MLVLVVQRETKSLRTKQKSSALLALVWYSYQNAKQKHCRRRLEYSAPWAADAPAEQWWLTPTLS